MNRFMGLEAMNINYELVNKKSRDLEAKALEYRKQGKHEQAVKAFFDCFLADKANCDAMVSFIPYARGGFEPHELEGMMDDCLAAGKKRLEKIHGSNFFLDESEGGEAGNFWAILDTRPWMRLQSSIGEVAAVEKEWGRAVDAMSECLRLRPGDNMGIRSKLTPMLIQAGRPADGVRFQFNWLLNIDERDSAPPLGGLKLDAFPTIDKDLAGPLASQIKDEIMRAVVAEMVYDLAIAAFSAFGDCELARFALKHASQKNPVVIGHILGKKGAPKDFNRLPYQLNSPQTAQDYLFLSYHIWMEPRTFAWAKNDKTVHQAVLKSCEGGCGKKETKHLEFQGCSACKRAFYCSPACQKKDWKNHKQLCKIMREKAEVWEKVKKGEKTDELVFAMDHMQI